MVSTRLLESGSPPAGTEVGQKVAIRHPGDPTWHKAFRQTAAPSKYSDLSLLPHKCGDEIGTRFIGDYHTAVGGKTHGHALRVDAPSGAGPPLVRLQASALSGSSWR